MNIAAPIDLTGDDTGKENIDVVNVNSSAGQKRSATSKIPTPKKLKPNLEPPKAESDNDDDVDNDVDNDNDNDSGETEDDESVEMHHPGELDEENWEDGAWDDWHWGEISTNANRRDCPEGFFWSCCGEIGTAKGCTRGADKFQGDLNARYPDYTEEGHPGKLEVDSDASFWDDWDRGERSSDVNRRKYPEGFRWSCCGQFGGTPGCQNDSADTEGETDDNETDKEEEFSANSMVL